MTLVALVLDAGARARIGAAVRGRGGMGETRFCARLAEVRQALGAGGVHALLVEPDDAGGRPTSALVREVRERFPRVTVVAYCAPRPARSGAIVDLVRAGAHQLLLRGVDDEGHSLRLVIDEAEQRAAGELVRAQVRARVAEAAWPLAELYLTRLAQPPSIAEAAAALGVHRRTLLNRLQLAGCPPPAELRTWCRLFVAARLLEEPGRTVESVAHQLEFPSAGAFRNALKRSTGLAPHEVRAGGGLLGVLACFDTLCQRRRGPVLLPPPRHPARVAEPMAEPMVAAAPVAP